MSVNRGAATSVVGRLTAGLARTRRLPLARPRPVGQTRPCTVGLTKCPTVGLARTRTVRLPRTRTVGLPRTRAAVLASGLCLALAASSAGAAAQSVFNAAGMGVPVEALDGRARALGNLGIGLSGSALLPTDPAAAGRLVTGTGIIAGQPSWVDYSRSGVTQRVQGTRFPLLGVAYPAFSGMLTIQLGAFLDQNYSAERSVTVQLVGGPVEATDRFQQEGAVSSLNVGYARMLGGRTSAGVSFGRYAGSIDRTLIRSFDLGTEGAVEDFVSRGLWSYSGYSITGGLARDLGGIARVAASATWSTSLEADASQNTGGADRSFALPLQYRLGTSASLAPGLIITASATYEDWSGMEDDLLSGENVRDARAYGAGIELSRARVFGRQAPLRFGYRHKELPFSLEEERATERVFAGGLGLTLSETQGEVLAGVDLAVERGRRSAGPATENFWRGTVSLRVSGF